jgi:hypothetical protein
MIDKTIHWDPELQKNQKELLESLPEHLRDFMAFNIRTGNVSCHYYKEQEAEPTEEDFEEWLKILPENIGLSFRKDGYEKSKGAIPLRRHTAERNDMGLTAYMKAALSEEDYIRWCEAGKE